MHLFVLDFGGIWTSFSRVLEKAASLSTLMGPRIHWIGRMFILLCVCDATEHL
eukprot:m.366059 g.366059  ORF g.366059 m.366059 type:complete len:53 (-) comp16658_c2_seq14:294-452(-)